MEQAAQAFMESNLLMKILHWSMIALDYYQWYAMKH